MDCANALLESGSDVNNEDMHHQTALFYAAKQGNIDMCAKLIEKGANINHVDNKKQTPLHWAQKSRRTDTVDYLISRGANPITRKQDTKRKNATKKKPTSERKEPKKYVLTVFKNGTWLPLNEADFEMLEKKECPEVAKYIKNPELINELEIPEIHDEAAIYDHWEKPAKRIVSHLWKQEGAWLFQYPVDTAAWGIEDYYTIIKTPMDLTTIKSKLMNNQYKFVQEFIDDINLIFSNCIRYNGETNQYSLTAKKIKKEFETLCTNLSMDFYKA